MPGDGTSGVRGLRETASRSIGRFLVSCFLISSFFALSIFIDQDVLRSVAISTAPLLYGNSAVVFSTRQRIGYSPPTSLSMAASHSSFHQDGEDDAPSFFFLFVDSPFLASLALSAAADALAFSGERKRDALLLVLLGEVLVSSALFASDTDALAVSDLPSAFLFASAISFLARFHKGNRESCFVLLPR